MSTSIQTGQRLEVDIRNASGGAMSAISFDTHYKLAGGTALTAPANGYRRKIMFECDDSTTRWCECWRSSADT